MKKMLLICLTLGIVFPTTWVKVSSIADNGDGTYNVELSYKSDENIGGFQLNLLSEGALVVSDPSGGAAGAAGMTMSHGASSGITLGFSFTGGVIPVSEDWAVLYNYTATVADDLNLSPGETVSLNATNDPPGGLIFSSVGGQALDTVFDSNDWGGPGNNTLDNDSVHPGSFSLGDNYPNPFNPSTEIEYSVASASIVNLSIYDASGRLVKTLVSGLHEPDQHKVVWDGTNENGTSVAAGMYFYKITAGNFVETKKMLLVK